MGAGSDSGERGAGTVAGLPLGALVAVAIGLLATAAAHSLADEDLITGQRLDWERQAEIPDSRPDRLGRDGEVRIVNAGISATRANTSGYSIFRIEGVLRVDPGAARRRIDADCTTHVPEGVIIARTPGRRASFPQPSEDLARQDVPEIVILRFNAKGSDTNGVELTDAFENYTDAGDALVEWSTYRQGRHTWEYVLRGGEADGPMRVSFASMWRTTTTPAGGRISCVVTEVGRGPARVETGGSLR
jgi:hypothetical protein